MNWEQIAAFVDQPATLWDCIVIAFVIVVIAATFALVAWSDE